MYQKIKALLIVKIIWTILFFTKQFFALVQELKKLKKKFQKKYEKRESTNAWICSSVLMIKYTKFKMQK